MKNFQHYRNSIGEYGILEEIRYPLANIRGLPGASLGELVMFPSGSVGQVHALNGEIVETLLLTRERLTPGAEAARTAATLSIPCGDHLRGATIDPLGEPLSGSSFSKSKNAEERTIDITPPHITARAKITRPLRTGTSVVDLLLPLGQGQREAIIGNLTTGKTSFLLTTVRMHSRKNIVVYGAIGKPSHEIKRVNTFIDQYANRENTILIGTSAQEAIGLTYLVPFAAMTIAEYWRDQGHNVLVILDDMSTHATFCREIGLLARQLPARQSYPGDIFHTHARIMERAGNFFHETAGETSITCLPVAETVQGDISNYIVSNLIAITDGHLLFDDDTFAQGRRPAINIPLSVTRVGGHTQTPMTRALTNKLVVLLNRHQQAQRYTHFGAELQEDIQRIIDAGDRLLELLSQPLFREVPYPAQIVMAGIIWLGWLNQYRGRIWEFRDALSEAYEANETTKDLFKTIAGSETIEAFERLLREQRENILTLCRISEK